MNLEQLRASDQIVQECVSGSKAYGLDTPTSDTDIKGVFVLGEHQFYGLEYLPQISDASNDTVFYELKRYVELLLANNPNILEMAATPERHIVRQHELMKRINVSDFVSKLCAKTFGGYALSQLKRARGLNKKIVNPMEGPRKGLLDFCYVNYQNGSTALARFLNEQNWKQQECGLAKIANMSNIFGLFHSSDNVFRGIISNEEATEVITSSIPKGTKQAALMYFNKEAYSQYCKDYKEYQAWVTNRNEARYESTLQHGKSYDAKNLMHTFRLLDMGIEIAETGEVNVSRPNRDFLLSIKQGDFEYDQLVEMAETKLGELEQRFAESKLPEIPDPTAAAELLVSLRQNFYRS